MIYTLPQTQSVNVIQTKSVTLVLLSETIKSYKINQLLFQACCPSIVFTLTENQETPRRKAHAQKDWGQLKVEKSTRNYSSKITNFCNYHYRDDTNFQSLQNFILVVVFPY